MERIIKESDFSVCFVYPPCLFYKVLIGDWDSVTWWNTLGLRIENLSYDARGNITSRAPRHGQGATVTLTYTGDRLATRKEGTGAAVPFAHDGFARMTTDAESGLSIAYNALDLPERISQGTTLKARYTYLSDGTKVSALDATGAGLVYRGPFTYRRNPSGALTFESAVFEGGRLTEAGPRYFVTDHLGSVRAVIDGNAASTATYPPAGFYSVDDYTPYGTKSTSSASSCLSLAATGQTVSLRDSFTGQEDQGPDFGLPYIDYGARQYSPALSRWLVTDPMGEKYYDISPYVYCAGNPVSLKDVKGSVIRLANNVSKASDYLAQIISTDIGRTIVTRLIESSNKYTLIGLTLNSFFSPPLGIITYAQNELMKNVDGGIMTPMISLSHELMHAYDDSTPMKETRFYAESRAVSFANYMRSAFSLNPQRNHYGAYTEGDFHQFQSTDKSETINDFKYVGSSKDKKQRGYSYSKTITKPNRKLGGIPLGYDSITKYEYVIVSYDKKKNLNYKIFDDEKEFLDALEGK